MICILYKNPYWDLCKLNFLYIIISKIIKWRCIFYYRFGIEMTPTRSVNAENKEFTDVPMKPAEAYFQGESRRWVRCKRTQLRAALSRLGGGRAKKGTVATRAIPSLTDSPRSREREKETKKEMKRCTRRGKKAQREEKEKDRGKGAKGGVRTELWWLHG